VDYLSSEQFVNLPTYNNKNTLCYDIQLVNDKDKESTESFRVILGHEISTPPNVVFEPSEAEVWIIDNDKGIYGNKLLIET